jgi:hypothetical protein
LDKVLAVLAHHIAQVRTAAHRYIVIEGLCSSASRLAEEDDRLELRLMDELFAVEKHIGEVQGVIGLQFKLDKESISKEEVKYETFEEEQPVVEEKKAEGAEGEPPADQPPAEGEAKKKPSFNPKDFTWTATDRRPKNLPQLFIQSRQSSRKAISHEVRKASEIGRSQTESIAKSLDQFASRIVELS